MAIIIPSKNIYERTNDKVIKNALDNVEINIASQKEVYTSTAILNTTYDLSGEFDSTVFPNLNEFIKLTNIGSFSGTNNAFKPATTLYYKTYIKTFEIKIPYKYQESFVNKEKIELKITKQVRKRVSSISGNIYPELESTANDSLRIFYPNINLPEEFYNYTPENAIINNASLPRSAGSYYITDSGSVVSSVETEFGIDDTVLAIPVYNEEDNTYSITFDLFCGVFYYSLQSAIQSSGVSGAQLVAADGIATEFSPLQINIELLNNVISLDSKTITENASTTKGLQFVSVSENSLLQENYKDEAKSRFSKTLEQYKNGKETATMLCSISDYEDENGTKVITDDNSSGKMSFKLYDEVVPLVRGAYGSDIPMSMTADGLVKSFAVLGSEVFYDGSVMQRLTLQEKSALDIQIMDGTKGLAYSLSEDGSYWICTGIGTATDTNIKVSTTINGKVVYELADGFIRGNNSIQSVVIPNTITQLPSNAFYECMKINSIKLPDTITSLGEACFSGCTRLININIPESLETIGAWAFDTCISLTYIKLNNKLTNIGDGAFYNCFKLKTIELPDTLTSIPEMAFARCDSLVNVKIPDSVTSLDYSSFGDCLGIKTVTIGSGITNIDANAFIDSDNITDIYLPYVLEGSIEGAPWGARYATVHYYQPKGYSIVSYANSVEEKDDGHKFIIQGVGTVYINGKHFLNINSPYSTITINATLENGFNQQVAFDFVGNYSRISPAIDNTSGGVQNYLAIKKIVKWNENITKTYHSMFRYQTINFDLNIPQSYTTISENTFENVTSTQKIVIPSNIKVIEKFAFYYSSISIIEFSHSINDEISLPNSGSTEGMFYDKNSRNMTIYTDNETIKNYDWTADNIVPTFYHLDGTAWE